MRIFITGGTGFVGTTLISRLAEQGNDISVLTRSHRKDRPASAGVIFIEGDPTKRGDWQEKVEGHDVIINLAGASIFSRWTSPRKRLIRESRVQTTRNLVEALSLRKGRETLFLSTSAVGYYGFHGDEDLDENSLAGKDFLASVTREWEDEAIKAEEYGCRVLRCRLGIVLGQKGGALGRMAPPIAWFLGSALGNGKQWLSWIHEKDLAEIYLFLITQKDISGPINCTAPYPVTNKEITLAIARTLNRPILLPPVPAFMIKLFLGEFASVLVYGQKALPRKLLDSGFRFRFSNIRDTLEDLLKAK